MKEDLNLKQDVNQIAQNWFEDRKWDININLQPHPSVNVVEFYIQYHNNKAIWNKVFSFLKEQDLEILTTGKYIIDEDNAFAMISEYSTKDIDDCRWESHLKYIDLQHIIKGKENMGITSIDKTVVTDPYDENNDIIFYTGEGAYHIASPYAFFLFFPQDVHRPCIKIGEAETVKKLVVKIKKVT